MFVDGESVQQIIDLAVKEREWRLEDDGVSGGDEIAESVAMFKSRLEDIVKRASVLELRKGI
jgi:hypothetical protein